MRKLSYCRVFVLIMILIFQVKGVGQTFESKVDSLLIEKYPDNSPGAVFLVSKKGKVVYNKAFGLSNLELKTPMHIDNVFEIGSITKQFTAISILMLAEEKKLNLNDTVSKYVRDYPNGRLITIHHLLTHTSGIRDFTNVKGLNTISKDELSSKELIDFFKDEPLDFLPGEKFKYCNAGYMLLGYIIEIISGKSYKEFIEQNIFDNLKMHNSYYASHQKVIPNRASGYSRKNSDYLNNRYISFSIPFAAGSLMSTVGDMLKWQEAINDYSLISKETTTRIFTDYTLNTGEPIEYGYGWHVKTLNGVQSYEHGGSIFGFKSMGVYLPGEDVYVISLSNCGCNSPTEITREIAKMASDFLD